ncbi:MAG: hypothetical protein V1927_02150 [Candidatus Omnitrophota bacterium]
MMMKGILISLALGYVLCVIAKKQEGILKSLGYTLGIATLVLSLMYGLIFSGLNCPLMGKMGGMCGMKGGPCHMMKR